MPDPWNDTWREAEASVPQSFVVYNTIELRHVAFQNSAGPFALRAVAGTADDQVLTLESGAPLDGGEAVTFTAVAFKSEFPEIAEGRLPSSQVTIDNVARQFQPWLERAVRYRADLLITFRQFRSDDPTGGPVYGPITFTMRNARVANGAIVGDAQLGNLANTKLPGPIYTTEQFPGLLVT